MENYRTSHLLLNLYGLSHSRVCLMPMAMDERSRLRRSHNRNDRFVFFACEQFVLLTFLIVNSL